MTVRAPRQILGIHQLEAKVGRCKTSIYTSLIPKHGFPAPIRIGTGRVGWFEDEVDAWLDQQPRQQRIHEASMRGLVSDLQAE